MKDIAVVTGYIMFYDMLQGRINGSFFSKIDRAIELAESFCNVCGNDYDWEENNFEDELEKFLKENI